MTHLKNISQLKGKALTLREIDVIACMLSGKGVKTLSDFLKIETKTFNAHWQNIKNKLDAYSKENLIDIIAKEGKRTDFFNHYEMLCMEEIFFESLEKIKENESVELTYSRQNFILKPYVDFVKRHLEFSGLKVKIIPEKDLEESVIRIKNIKTKERFSYFLSDLELNPYCYFLFIIKILKNIDPDLLFDVDKFKSLSTYTNSLPKKSIQEKISFSLVNFKKMWTFMGLFILLLSLVSFYVYQAPSYKLTIDEPFLSNFIKRKDLDKKIDVCLNKKDQISYCALIGIKGSGKTVLAKMYAKNAHSSIAFELDAKSMDSIERSYFKLAYVLVKDSLEREDVDFINKIEDASLRHQQLLVFVQRKLRQNPGWLLIFDNVLSIQDIENFIPKDASLWGNGKIIFTSCNRNISQIISEEFCVFVDELSNEDAFNIMRSKNTALKDDEITDLLTKTPHFPLDVSLAASYIKESKMTYDSYRALLEKKVIKERSDILRDSFTSLIKSNEEFKDLLFFVSLFDFKNIPISLLYNMFSQEHVDSFMSDLKKYSFVTDESQKKEDYYFSIHPFIHEQSLVYATEVLSTNKMQDIINKKMSFLIDNVVKKRVLFSFYEASVPHLESLYQTLKMLNIKSEKTDFLLNYSLGFAHYFGSRKIERSLRYLSQVVMSSLKSEYLSRKEERDILFILSILYTDMGKGDEAVQVIEKGLLLCDDDLFKQAEFLSQKGYALSLFNKFEHSKLALDKAIEILDCIEQDQKTKNLKSTIKGQLAALYGASLLTRDIDKKAVKFIDEAFIHLNYDHKLQKNIPRFICYHLATLGHVYCHYGEFDKAMKEGFDKALYIIDHQLDGCPHYIIKLFSQSGVGECLLRSGKIKEAKDLLKNVVSRIYDLRGDQFHPVYRAQTHLMECNIRLGLYEEAEENLNDLLHFNVDGSSNNILFAECLLHYNAGLLYQKKGCLDDSYRHYLIFFNKMKKFMKDFDQKSLVEIDEDIHHLKKFKNKESDLSDIKKRAKIYLNRVYPMIDFM